MKKEITMIIVALFSILLLTQLQFFYLDSERKKLMEIDSLFVKTHDAMMDSIWRVHPSIFDPWSEQERRRNYER